MLVGLDRPDDAGIYRLTEEVALVQTVDFFTPIVDDPRIFGRIAAANALSDVYAMGGRPITAMSLVCFPGKSFGIEVLRATLTGGLDALREASVPLVGGHSVEDSEFKFGFSVTGLVDPRRFFTRGGVRAGDRLVLTKPLGTGIISTAVKAGLAPEAARDAAIASMVALNRKAAERMIEEEVHACTDVTGFGFLGHALAMVDHSPCGLLVRAGAVPLLPDTLALAGMGLCPGGLERNRTFYGPRVEAAPGLSPLLVDILHDPQTSGGLLVALPPDGAERYVAALRLDGNVAASVVAEVVADLPGGIRLVP